MAHFLLLKNEWHIAKSKLKPEPHRPIAPGIHWVSVKLQVLIYLLASDFICNKSNDFFRFVNVVL